VTDGAIEMRTDRSIAADGIDRRLRIRMTGNVAIARRPGRLRLEDLIRTIRGKVERFNVDKVRQEDIVASGGGGADEE